MFVECADRPVEREGDAAGGEDGDGGPGHVEGGAVRVDEAQGLGVVHVVRAVDAQPGARPARGLADGPVQHAVRDQAFFKKREG